MSGPDVYLLTVCEQPYEDPRLPAPVNAVIVHADTLRHRAVPQPDGGMIYRCLTEHPRQPHEIVPLSTLTYELDGGQLWDQVGDWEAVADAVVRLARAGKCDAMPLGLPDVNVHLLAMGPTSVINLYNRANGATEHRGPHHRQDALDELNRHLQQYIAEGPFWPGNDLTSPPTLPHRMPYKPWRSTG